jgi:HK97 family phage major capsid protein
MKEEDFQKNVLETVGQLKTAQEKLLSDVGNLQKETKQALEDFTNEKNNFASSKDVNGIMAKLGLLQTQLGNEKRMAFGDPVKRLANNEAFRCTFMAKLLGELELLSHPRVKASGVFKELQSKGFVAKDLDSGNAPGSTYLDTNEVEREIYDALLTYGAFRTMDVRMIGRKATEIPIKTARPVMLFVDEAAAIGADATKAGSRITVTAKKVGGLISTTTELEEDDVIGVVEDILRDFMEAYAYRLDFIALTANGDADNVDGGFSGMFYGGTAKVAAATHTTMATITYADVLACLTGVDAAVLQRGVAKWWSHPTIVAKTMGILDLNGRPIFQTAIEAPSFGAIGTILGFPVVMAGAAPSTDAASAKLMAFGDPYNQAVRIRRDFTFDRSEHFAFNTDELTYRATGRAASKTKIATSTTVLTAAAA